MINIIKSTNNNGSVRFTIPAKIAKNLNIRPSDFFGLEVLNDKIILSPTQVIVS